MLDKANGESYLPAENFSNIALLLAAMYKGEKQTLIQGTFNKLYDLIQGTQEANLFETPDNTPRTLSQAIKEVLNIDYNGQQRSNVLVGDTATSQRGQQGSTRDAATRERTEDGERTADSAGGIEGDSRGIRSESEDRTSQSEENATGIKFSMSANEAIDFVVDMELIADIAPEIDLTIENWDALFGESGTINTPIGEVKMGENQFTKLMRQGREGKLGMIKPTLENPHAIVEEASEAKEGDTTEISLSVHSRKRMAHVFTTSPLLPLAKTEEKLSFQVKKKAATRYCDFCKKEVSFVALRKMRLPLRLKGKVWTMSSQIKPRLLQRARE